MKILIPALIVVMMIACSPAQNEEADAKDSTSVELPIDSTSIATSTSSVEVGEEYFIEDGYSYIVDPFDFSLDSASIIELLGPDATIEVTETPDGEDEEGPYSGYSFYKVSHPEANMSFYSYSGKHYADVTTSKVPFKNGVIVGMTKSTFIKAMNLPDEALKANTFTINDDYGSMSFDFYQDSLSRIYVNYEEGT